MTLHLSGPWAPPAPSRAVGAATPTLVVDLTAVARNTRILAARATGELMAVVKADGFGHGAVDVARTALTHGATRLGVTSVAEAMALRDAGVVAPVLSWLNTLDADFAAAVLRDIDIAVPSGAHLAAVASAASARVGPARVHLHADVGMARDGADPAAWPALCRAARLAEVRGQVTVVGVMGHLGCAGDPDDSCNSLGRARFVRAVEIARVAGLRPRDLHLAATAATLTDPRSHHTMSRVGAGLVGIDPSRTTALEPAMTLTASLVQVRRVPAGTPVGYGHHHRTRHDTHLGLVPLGYADGLPLPASGRAEVFVRGARRPVVGRISMDQFVVDLGSSGAAAGEIVTVFGAGLAGEPTVAEWASWAGTIEHEIVTGIGARVAREVHAAPYMRGLA